MSEQFFEGKRHRAATGAAGEHKSAIDVEKDKVGRGGQAVTPYSLRTLPARGPLADGSSSKLTRWPSFS
jgi:hypothetical protein